ncbi:hypothetical protein Tco_0164362 [Tanacetum coccineum]
MIVSTSMIFLSAISTEYLVSTVDGTMLLKELNSAEVRLLSTRFHVLAIIMSFASNSGPSKVLSIRESHNLRDSNYSKFSEYGVLVDLTSFSLANPLQETMNDPNITMEEHYYEDERFTNFEEEFPAIVFGKINGNSFDSEQEGIMREYNDEREAFETEFPSIVFNNTSDTTPPCESTVSPPNENELDFRVSCDESDAEDYTVIFDKNSFSYKIISVNDLKMVSENDNNYMALSPNPTIDHNLDYFDDFKNEFPAIVYNDGLTSKSDLGIKPLVSSKSTDEFSLTDETSLSEYDKEIISRFNDLFNDIHSDNSKSELDNDDNNIGKVQSSEGNENVLGKIGFRKQVTTNSLKLLRQKILSLISLSGIIT